MRNGKPIYKTYKAANRKKLQDCNCILRTLKEKNENERGTRKVASTERKIALTWKSLFHFLSFFRYSLH